METIVINHLTEEDFCSGTSKTIKKLVYSGINDVQHYDELPFLNRIVIILDSESTAALIDRLVSLYPHLDVSLQEGLRKCRSR